MTREEVMNKWIWTSRLIFKAGLMYGKKYKDLTEDEEYEMRLVILQEQKEREEREARLDVYNTRLINKYGS